MNSIYLSHSSRDKEFVRTLARSLKDAGFDVWLDEWNLQVGDSIADSISRAIRDARFLLVIMSPDLFSSEWATQEWQAAMLEEMNSKTVKVIPIMYRDCEVPMMLANKRWVDFRDRDQYQDSLNALVDALRHYLAEPEEEAEQERLEPPPGHLIQGVDKGTVAELTEALRSAVEAFQSKPPPPSSPVSGTRPVAVESDLVFVVMPFGSEELNVVYEDFVKPTLEDQCQLRCERGDDVFGSNVIMEDIRASIEKAGLVLADLTGRNANVFYEVGIAHTLDKKVLLLAQSIDDVPFDLRHRRVLVYEYSPRGCKKLEKDLAANVTAMRTA